jgi:hypothetical protein
MNSDMLKSDRMVFKDSLEEIEDKLYKDGCTDGLPIVPPTEERVMRMIEHNKLNPSQVIAAIPPQNGPATVEKIAINAVMAGCKPEYLPVIIAAVEAMTSEGFDLFGVQATTHPCAMLTLVNGPIAKTLEINAGSGAMGPCWRANATIGRAVRLILLNCGGAFPGKVDKATQGTPAKFSFCVAENEEANPWEPFHVERGFKPTDSTVTVLGAEGPHDINGGDATKASNLLRMIASSMMSAGCSNARFTKGADIVLCVGPEHAAIFAKDGVTKDEVKEYIFNTARIPLDYFSEEHLAARKRAPAQHGEMDGKPIPIAMSKENILIFVAGGAGLHSSWMPTWGAPKHVAKTQLIHIPE